MKVEKIILFVLFLLAIYFPIFLHLDYVPLHRWDEATSALQAFEMSENGNYLRRFFVGNPDTWETKPPMLVWLQVLSMKIIGYNELAVRLPSALAALGTIFLIIQFFYKEFQSYWLGIFSTLTLICSSGYVRGHVTRSGDHDALLIFFLVAGAIYFYKFLNYPERKTKYFTLFVMALIGGVLTKSVAGLYFAPGLLCFTLVQKKLKYCLAWKGFYLGILAFFVMIGGYYALNEYYYPGYLQQVWENELFPRYFNTATTYSYNSMPSAWFFTQVLYEKSFKWFFYLVPLSLLLIAWSKDRRLKNFLLFISINTLIFHLIVSNGTFNSWYNAPIFPLLAIIVGTGLYLFFLSLKETFLINKKWKKYAFSITFCLTFFLFPYKEIILDQCYVPQPVSDDARYGGALKEIRKERPELKNLVVYYEPINRHFLFYSEVYNKYHGYQIKSCGSGGGVAKCKPHQQAKVGDVVLFCNNSLKEQLAALFNLQKLKDYYGCTLYQVISKKEEQ